MISFRILMCSLIKFPFRVRASILIINNLLFISQSYATASCTRMLLFFLFLFLHRNHNKEKNAVFLVNRSDAAWPVCKQTVTFSKPQRMQFISNFRVMHIIIITFIYFIFFVDGWIFLWVTAELLNVIGECKSGFHIQGFLCNIIWRFLV